MTTPHHPAPTRPTDTELPDVSSPDAAGRATVPGEHERRPHDLDATERHWRRWVEEAATLLGIDPDEVDIRAVHQLTKVVAHQVDRPLAPVAAYMLGLAIGRRGRDADPTALKDALVAHAKGPRHPEDVIPG